MILNSLNNIISIKEQKENLLKLNNDLLFWVYEILESNQKEIILKNKENMLVWFPEKVEKLKWLKENSDILILDIKEFRAWNLKTIDWKNLQNSEKNLTLLSSWVIEFVESDYKDKNWNIKKRKHFPTTLRDNCGLWAELRNPVAWRNSTSDLFWDIEREYSEESPFLTQKNNVFFISIPKSKNLENSVSNCILSINSFLEEKYLTPENENFLKAKNIFEKSFKNKLKYENLWNILKGIIKNKRFDFYENEILEDFNDFEGIKKDIKNIKIINKNWKIISSWNFFVYENKNSKTIEYMQIRKIFFPDWLISPTWKLYLESQNQGSKNERIEKLWLKTIPVVKYFSKKVLEKIEK